MQIDSNKLIQRSSLLSPPRPAIGDPPHVRQGPAQQDGPRRARPAPAAPPPSVIVRRWHRLVRVLVGVVVHEQSHQPARPVRGQRQWHQPRQPGPGQQHVDHRVQPSGGSCGQVGQAEENNPVVPRR